MSQRFRRIMRKMNSLRSKCDRHSSSKCLCKWCRISKDFVGENLKSGRADLQQQNRDGRKLWARQCRGGPCLPLLERRRDDSLRRETTSWWDSSTWMLLLSNSNKKHLSITIHNSWKRKSEKLVPQRKRKPKKLWLMKKGCNWWCINKLFSSNSNNNSNQRE